MSVRPTVCAITPLEVARTTPYRHGRPTRRFHTRQSHATLDPTKLIVALTTDNTNSHETRMRVA